MELVVEKRTREKKTEVNKLRREGKIPAVLYSKGEKGQEIVVDGNEFKKILNRIERGTLSSQVVTLKLDGKEIRTLVRDIQYHVTTYEVLHLDFIELHEKQPVTLRVPVRCINSNDCVGVKQGGVLRQVRDHLQVRCLPGKIPARFEIDVRDLKMGQTLKLNRLSIPADVRPLMDLNEVAVVVGKR